MSINNNTEIKKDIRRVTIPSIIMVLALLTMMMFSPFASQYYDGDVVLSGSTNNYDADGLIEAHDHQRALQMLDSIIADNSNGLPRFAYFDRFLSDEDYEDALERRAEVYDLQWKRIKILKISGDTENLKRDLKRYSRIIGYHQDDAKAMLTQISE